MKVPTIIVRIPEWGIAYSKNTPSSSATRLESVHWGDWEGDVETCIKSNTWPRLVLPVLNTLHA